MNQSVADRPGHGQRSEATHAEITVPPDECLLPRQVVEQRVGLKRSAIYERMKKGTFPKAIPDEETHSVWWRKSEIDAYVEKKIRRALKCG